MSGDVLADFRQYLAVLEDTHNELILCGLNAFERASYLDKVEEAYRLSNELGWYNSQDVLRDFSDDAREGADEVRAFVVEAKSIADNQWAGGTGLEERYEASRECLSRALALLRYGVRGKRRR